MKGRKRAYRKACGSGNWSRYKNMMDHILNKWCIYHFHSNGGKELVFVCLPSWSDESFIIDIAPHEKDWGVERRLVEIIVKNWPEVGIAIPLTPGKSTMTEEEHFRARKCGVNMPVEVSGHFYVSSGGLMSDGSALEDVAGRSPVFVIGAKHDPDANSTTGHLDDSRFMLVGVDKGDPTPPWMAAAGHVGMLARIRRERRFWA